MNGDASVVAVDVGTSAVRTALVDRRGNLLRSVRQERTSAVGGELFDAVELWADVKQAIYRLDAKDESVAALAVSAHIGTVAVDDSMTPVLSAGGWADTRGVSLLEEREQIVVDSVLAAAGRPAMSGGALPVALELKALGVDRRVSSLLSPKDFIVAKMTGRSVTDTINAAYTLASDIYRGDWQWETLQRLSVPDEWFPLQLDPYDIVAEVKTEIATECLLPEHLPVICGGPDGSIGLGLLLDGAAESIANVAGTTDVLGTLHNDGAPTPSNSIINPALDRGKWVAGGSTGLTGGAVANWRSIVNCADEGAAVAIDPGSGGLRIIPTISGERFPRWNPSTRGAVLGLTADHGGPALLRAAQEGAAFTVREGLDLLDVSRLKPVIIAGGSARSPSVAQLRADIFGRIVQVASSPDVTLLGTAGLAFVATGFAGSLSDVNDIFGIELTKFEPRETFSRAYEGIFEDWKRVREITSQYDRSPTEQISESMQHLK